MNLVIPIQKTTTLKYIESNKKSKTKKLNNN